MKNILEAPFVSELSSICSNMYRLGWDERNGGNISCLLEEKELSEYLDITKVIREIPIGFDASMLSGKYFIVTGTGKYFRNIEKNPEENLGIIRIKEDGITAQLLWGYSDGGKFTSELPAHLMSHIVRLEVDPNHKVVMHAHPDNIIALTYLLDLNDKEFSKTLWQFETECIIVFPEGVGVLPWMVCGTNEIGVATAKKMEEFRLVIWPHHGIYGVGKDLDEAFGLIETVEKAAKIYLLTAHLERKNTITNDNLKQLAKAFNLDYRKEFLD